MYNNVLLGKNNGWKNQRKFDKIYNCTYNMFKFLFINLFIKMTTKNPETLRELESPSTKQELKELELSVSRDRENFEKLSKSSVVKKWLDKIVKKESEHTISMFWEWYKNNELNRHLSIESWTRLVINAHPDLAGFICWDLWLPYEEMAVRGMKNTKFSQLTFEQKMNFISFHEALRYYWNDISKVSSKDFINQCKTLMSEHAKSITDRFNQRVNDSKNIFWSADIDWVLKKDYWLTDTECKKVKEYIELIQKHPEYVWWPHKPLEAWFWTWFFVGVIVTAIVWVLGYYAFDNIFGLQSTEQVSSWGRVEMVNFEQVFEILSAKAEFAVRDEEGDDAVINYREDAIKFKEGWPRYLKLLKNWAEEVVNFFEWRSIDLKARVDVWYTFDASNAKCTVEKKNWKWIFRVKIKKPKLVVMDVEAEVVRSRREKIVNLNKFDDFELRALESVKDKALAQADKPENLRRAKEALRENMLSVFRTTWYSGWWISVDGKDVQDVIVEFED